MSQYNDIKNGGMNSLQNSFHEWDGGEPTPELWDDLEAELSLQHVWSSLSDVLENDHNMSDNSIFSAYENWSPNFTADGWSKLDEQLSRERVWTRLSQTLNFPIHTAAPWIKMAAASILFMLLAFYTDYVTPSTELSSQQTSSLLLIKQDVTSPKMDLSENLVQQTAELTKSYKPAIELPINTIAVERTLIDNQSKVLVAQEQPGLEHATTQKETRFADLSFDEIPTLDSKLADFEVTQWELGDFTLIPQDKSNFKPRFSVQIGGQFAFINENRREQFASSLPSMGIAADLQYHAYFKQIRFTQNIGFSQYVQSNGNYVNGKFMSTYQRLNTLYLSSAVGFRYQNLTLFGGVSMNHLLNGYESNSRYITNVYQSNKIQLGAIAGLDYHFSPFKNKTAMGVGVQYQWVSKIKSGNTLFNDIQGVKLQIKYSF